jgi:hypothetical protein
MKLKNRIALAGYPKKQGHFILFNPFRLLYPMTPASLSHPFRRKPESRRGWAEIFPPEAEKTISKKLEEVISGVETAIISPGREERISKRIDFSTRTLLFNLN